MATNYPSGYDTSTSGSLNNSKANKEAVVDVTYDVDATEWNTHADAILAVERKVGDGSATLTNDGDADEYNVREIMDFMTVRADRGFINEHFLFSAHSTAIANDIATASAYDSTNHGADACGVASITLAAGVTAGWHQVNEHFWMRGGYFRCRWYIDALPATNGDAIEMGFYFDANNYVLLRSVRAGGAWPDFIIEVNSAAASHSETLTGSAPSAATWYVSEILTSATDAVGFIDRAGQGTGTEYTATESTQAPADSLSHFYFSATSSVGGEVISLDSIGAGSTTVPL